MRIDERHHYDIEVSGTRVQVLARVGSLRTVVAEQSVPAGPVVLAVTIAEPPSPHGPCTGPDVISLGVEQPDGTFTELATLDGRYLSTEVAAWLHRSGHRHVRRGGHRPLRLVRLRAPRRLNQTAASADRDTGRSVMGRPGPEPGNGTTHIAP